MRGHKKYFFVSLIQLTLLANVFRQNNRFTSFDESLLNHESNFTFLITPLDDQGFFNSLSFPETNFTHEETNSAKEIQSYLNELRVIDRINRLTSPVLTRQQESIVIQPASAIYGENQKAIIDLSETRILLNSIEMNAHNNHTLRKEFEMDIELQTLIQQDIDLGIKNSYFYDVERQQIRPQLNNETLSHDASQKLNVEPSYSFNTCKLNKMKHLFQNQFDENQKHQDILSATKFIENEQNAGKYKLCVEEDTGEILYQYNGALSNSSEEYRQTLSNLNATNRNLTNKELCEIDMPMKHKPSDRQIVFTKPIFLSQTSVCKELKKLNENTESMSRESISTTSPNNISNMTVDDSALTLNPTMLNEYLDLNLLNEVQKPSFDIQQDLGATNFTNNEEFMTNQTQMMPDVFDFDDDFLKTFEKNLNRFNCANNDSNNSSMITQNSDNIYFNQTIHQSTPAIAHRQPTHNNNNNNSLIPNQFIQNQTRIESESLNYISDQLDLNLGDIFKTFDSNQQNSSLANFTGFTDLSNKNLTNGSILKPVSNMPNSVLVSHDEERNSVLNANFNTLELKQEMIEIDEKPQETDANNNELQTTNDINESTINNSNQIEATSYASTIDHTSDEVLATIRGLNHNHTYMDGVKAEDESEVYHPYSYKNKQKKLQKNLKNNDINNIRQQESRDQILLQENNINLSMHHIVDSTADEFNDIIKSIKLTMEQLSIVKDIRRRGKNKVAAQICRKRKIDSIDSLKEDVENLSEKKAILEQERETIENEVVELTMNFDQLYQELMGEEYELNDPILMYMNNLKSQVNINIRLKQMTSNSLNSGESENSQEYELNSPSSDISEGAYEDESHSSNLSTSHPNFQHANNIEESFNIENLISNKKVKVEQEIPSLPLKKKAKN